MAERLSTSPCIGPSVQARLPKQTMAVYHRIISKILAAKGERWLQTEEARVDANVGNSLVDPFLDCMAAILCHMNAEWVISDVGFIKLRISSVSSNLADIFNKNTGADVLKSIIYNGI